MTLYAVGDLQGCREPLEILLNQVGFDASKDRLWLTGDLVNRGPDSLGTLRLIHSMGDAAQTVLGNHDLHLLALANQKKVNTANPGLNAVLTAPDGEQLLEWLSQQPLLRRDKQRKLLMTHAGIPPNWSDKTAIKRAHQLEKTLRHPQKKQLYFKHLYGDTPIQWQKNLSKIERWRYITNAFTRMRYCGPQGQLEFVHSNPNKAPKGMKAWFEWPAKRKHRLLFGHWAALMGRTQNPNILGLDTGYIWNNYLTLLNVDNGQTWQCNTQGQVSLQHFSSSALA